MIKAIMDIVGIYVLIWALCVIGLVGDLIYSKYIEDKEKKDE